MLCAIILLALPFVSGIAVPTPQNSPRHDHTNDVRRALPATWYQRRDHPVHELFGRGSDDGVTYAAVGTPAWSASYPVSSPDVNALPAPWVAALNAAVAAGKIPDVPVSTNTPGTNPVYPNGINPSGPTVCSATYKCRIPGDIWDSPDGVFASSFDDGPTTFTQTLVQFLGSNNLTTTHFMIGINIVNYPSQFLEAFQADHDIAVHTWTHPYMTTLSNLQIVGQLGWTMQVIHNSTGGRVPRYWRPPYGDSDMRVRSIASEVFGLETVVWNQDTSDWNSAPPAIEASMTRFLTGPKSPGLIILEHELSSDTVTGFLNSYSMINANGWKFVSLAKAINDGITYQNANGSLSDDVEAADILVSSSSASSSAPSSTTSVSPTTGPITSTGTAGNIVAPTTSKSSAITWRSNLPYGLMLTSLVVGTLTGATVLLS